MQTHQIRVSEGRDRVAEMPNELFVFPEVIDVFITGRADALVVVFVGRPRPREWLRTLRSLGYHIPPRRQAPPTSPETDRRRPSRIRANATRGSRRQSRVVLRGVVE